MAGAKTSGRRDMKTYQFDQEAYIRDLQSLLRIKSVREDCGPVTEQAPLGQGIYDALDFMLELGKEAGFRTKMLDGKCAWIEAGEGDEMIGILAHMDTVPVEDGWLAPPFDGTLIDGKLYGRGVSDDKGPALIALYAMKALGKEMRKRVRLILGGDEEGGDWRCMKRYRETEEMPSMAFTPDAEYPVTYAEKGILHITISGNVSGKTPLTITCDNAYNVVPPHATAEFGGKRYEAEGRSAHAMEPEKGDNALLKLCAQLSAEGAEHPFLELAKIATTEGLGIALADEPSGKLTINPSIAHVNAEKAELSCDLRVPVTFGKDTVIAAIEKAVAPLGFQVSSDYFQPPLYVKKDSPLVTTLQQVYHEFTGANEEPVSTGGGTYARAFSNAVAFGALLPDDEVTYHRTNEYWKIDSIAKSFQIIANAVAALSK